MYGAVQKFFPLLYCNSGILTLVCQNDTKFGWKKLDVITNLFTGVRQSAQNIEDRTSWHVSFKGEFKFFCPNFFSFCFSLTHSGEKVCFDVLYYKRNNLLLKQTNGSTFNADSLSSKWRSHHPLKIPYIT